MADQDGARPQAPDERLKPGQPVQVEVVGRLVEQEDVVPAQQQRSQAGPAACPPDRAVISRSRSTVRPSPAATASARASRSAPPSASHRSSAFE